VPLAVAAALLIAYLALMPLIERAPALAARLAPRPAGEPTLGAAGGAPAGPAALAALAAEAGPKRRIAVALEFGDADRAVLDHVRAIPFAPDAGLLLLHVAESAASRYLGPESADLEAREDLAALGSLAGEFRTRGVPTEVMLGFGDVKSELARMVTERGADLLIVGAHGHTLLQDLFYGATTSALRHRVRCPVLIVPPRDRP